MNEPLDPSSRYFLGQEIGRGGVGVVHEGWDSLLNRKVAIKRLLPKHDRNSEVVRRFMKEARIGSRLQHPGTVPIHEVGTSSDGRPYFVMGLVRGGESLDRILGRRESPEADLSRILNVYLQICETMAYAHMEGVIHRDLKPSNVIVGSFGEVKVADWGSAKVLCETPPPSLSISEETRRTLFQAIADADAGLTQFGAVFGTPAYLPPEQARGENERIGKRSDVFGLGSILCEILTGRPPYVGSYGSEVFKQAAKGDTQEVLTRLESTRVAVDLISLTRWCLSKRPEDRPANAAEVVEVLESYLHCDQRRAEKDLVRFFDLSLDLFCIASFEGVFLRVNENFPRLLGYDVAELTSRPFIDFVHPDDRQKTVDKCSSITFGQQCVRFRNRYRHADGRYLWFEWNAQAWPEDRAIYAVARDVTKRIEAFP
ncbi:MAG TPA: protein kinase [Pirellulaceae bacterium]|jgi:serine/threonine-protein kinase|nr:protein kinase [Pirellulaceae bacterium]